MLGTGFAQKETGNPASASSDAQAKSSASQSEKSTGTEGKIQSYKGELVPASCGGAAASSATPASGAKSGEANRAAESGGSQSCSPSSNVTEFALKTKDGRTLPFDLVGNARAQDAIKNKKKWQDAASAGKPVHVKVHAAEEQGKLTVMSIH